jgi:hypothetical protein
LLAPSSVPLEVHQQSGESAPQAQQDEQIDPHAMLEILPASFVGCWRGVVARPDSSENLNGCVAGAFVPEADRKVRADLQRRSDGYDGSGRL